MLLTFGARAISIDNVHVSQPILRRSPATNNPDDMFGFATIMHQIEVVNNRDSLEDAAGKTRLEQSPNYFNVYVCIYDCLSVKLTVVWKVKV